VNIGIYFVTIENNRRIQWWKEIVSSQNRLRQIGCWTIADDPAAIIDRWRPGVQKLIRHNDASVTSLGRNATEMGRRTDLSLFVPYGEKKNNISCMFTFIRHFIMTYCKDFLKCYNRYPIVISVFRNIGK